MVEKYGTLLATIMSAIAVCVSTFQAWLSWDGRNSHIALNLHSQQMRTCASIMTRLPDLLDGVSALADKKVATESWGSEQAVAAQRAIVTTVRGEIIENLQVISMISDEHLAAQANKLALNVQNLMNNASGLKDLNAQGFKDLRDGLGTESVMFANACRERLRPAGT